MDTLTLPFSGLVQLLCNDIFECALTFQLQSLLGPTRPPLYSPGHHSHLLTCLFLTSFSSLVSVPDTEQTHLSKVHVHGGEAHFLYILQFVPALHYLCPS